MTIPTSLGTALITFFLSTAACFAEEQAVGSPGPTPGAIEAAIRKSIPLLEKTAAGTSEHRRCFTCHGHAVPVLVIVEARKRGFAIDEDNLKAQVDHTIADLVRGKERYLEGRGQGGGHIRAGYALWTLNTGGWKPDETTGIVSEYLLSNPEATHWRSGADRPPSEASPFTATFVALRGITDYATEEQAARVDARKTVTLDWLLDTSPEQTEDHVFRLLALDRLDAGEEVLEAAAKQLIETQRDDGGWAQNADLDSDVYATGSTLYALHQATGLVTEDEVYRRGLKFLLNSQLEDGSWLVRSRSKPFQSYYESGYPHEKDQFISMTAGGWATLALLFACEK